MKDISWKRFGVCCMLLGSFVLASETAAWNPRASATEGEAPPAAQGEQLAPEDVPPPLPEKELKQLQPEPAKPTPAETVQPSPELAQKTSKLKVTVIDGRTKKPIEGAEAVVLETGDRARTDAKGDTPYMNEPVPRYEKGKLLLNKLHGQLAVIVYKKGYRDSITFGVRMHEGIETRTTVWMYPIENIYPRRIEPVLYMNPYHRLYLIQLADAFRSSPDEGEGMESPDR